MRSSRAGAVLAALAAIAGVAWWIAADEDVPLPADARVDRAAEESEAPAAELDPPPVPVDPSSDGAGRIAVDAPAGAPAPGGGREPLPPLRARGRIVDGASGSAIAGARARIAKRVEPDRGILLSATTDSDGRFEGIAEEVGGDALQALEREGIAGELVLMLDAEGYAHTRFTQLELLDRPLKKTDSGFVWDLAELRLFRGAAVRGRVLFAETRAPVPDAELRLFDADGRLSREDLLLDRTRTVGSTGSDGGFELRERLPGARGEKDAVLFALSPGGLGWSPVTILEGRGEVALEILIHPPGALEVAVRREGGTPVPGAEILALPTFEPLAPPSGIGGAVRVAGGSPFEEILARSTDENGGAFFDRLPCPERGGRYVVQVTAEGFAEMSGGPVWIERRGRERIEVVLRAPKLRSVSGIVRREEGAPLSGAEVRARCRERRLEITTDSAGRFSLDGLDPCALDLRVRADGFVERSFVFEVSVETDLEGIDIVLFRPLPIEGHVVDGGGIGVAGASVWIGQQSPAESMWPGGGRTDADGRFAFPTAWKGEWLLQVDAPQPWREWSRPHVMVPVQGGDRGVLVVLERLDPGASARLVADVVDSATGASLDPTLAAVVSTDITLGASARVAEARRETGRVTAGPLGAGPWRVWAKVAGRPAGFADFTVEPGASEVRARVEIGDAGSIEGRVLFDGPVGYRPCKVGGSVHGGHSFGGGDWHEDGVLRAQVDVQPDGTFHMEGLAPGEWRLGMSGGDLVGETRVRVPSGSVARAEIRPAIAGRVDLRGRVPRRDAGIHVEIDGGQGWESRGSPYVHEDKSFLFVVRRGPGRVRWRVVFEDRSPGGEPRRWAETQEGEVEIVSGETIEVEVPVVPLPGG